MKLDERIVALEKAASILRKGGLVAFPTETVYGLGARAFDPEAIRKIYLIKRRPLDNPLILHIGRKEDAWRVAARISLMAQKLMDAFWPGPLTLILPKNRRVPKLATGGMDTAAVRMPNHPLALGLLRALGEPIAAPSANISGRPSPTQAEHVRLDLGEQVDMILDGGPTENGLESTIIDTTNRVPRLLRPGVISRENLEKVIGSIDLLSPEAESDSPLCPGTNHRHYAPNCKIVLFNPEQWSRDLALKKINGKVGLLCRSSWVKPRNNLVYFRRINGDLKRYAKNLFASLRQAEAAGVELLYVETVPDEGLGAAIMDRLIRASQAPVEK